MASTKLYYYRKENGLCIQCGNLIDREGARCTKCNNIQNEDARLIRQYRVKYNICTVCGKESTISKMHICPECLAMKANQKDRWKANNRQQYLKTQKKSNDRRYSSLKEQGICVKCGKRKAKEGNVSCGWCLIKERDYDNRRNLDKTHKPYKCEWLSLNLCAICGNPSRDGMRVCDSCYSNICKMANLPQTNKAREKMKEQGIGIYRKFTFSPQRQKITYKDEPKKYNFFKGIYYTDKELSKM